jgi:hypothetical protein
MSEALSFGGARAGMANCVCPPGSISGSRLVAGYREIGLLGAGAVASLLSQALMFSLLPLAGAVLAPVPALSAVPFIALFVGTIVATFPAAILSDAFGRRAAFALGASLGIAGGLVVAWSLIFAAFWPLAVGAFWIGIANGFALRYRHAAAAGEDSARAIAIVVGSGALIGIAAPTLASVFEVQLTPFFGAGAALLAALAHVAALGTALLLPPEAEDSDRAVGEARDLRAWLVPTAISAAAWFGMMAVMAFAPLGLADCGVAFTTTVGAIAWHLVAMYAPALALGVLAARLSANGIAGGGLALVAAAIAVLGLGAGEVAIFLALIAAGAGWSLATSGALLALHRAAPSRFAVAAHDFSIVLAGVAGALASGWLIA